jgi:Fe/S biogenesis protein NfuA
MSGMTVLDITPKARARVLEVRAGEVDGDQLALWLEVVGVTGGEFAYDLYFDLPAEATADDLVEDHDGLTVVIPWDSVERLQGATLDMSRDLLNPTLVVTNPNKPPQETPAMGPPPELTGTVEEKVEQLLTEHINPSLGAHGGQATLVAVEDGVAYLRFGGGCVGCGQATATMSQGIDGTIRQLIPEITKVVDVTDHASGTNPYYEPAAT